MSTVHAPNSRELIHAAPTDIAIVKNVSEGINAIATAIPWRAGDNVVLCAGLEHPNNVLPWIHLRRLGVEMRVIEPVEGAIDADCHHRRHQRADARRHVLVGHFRSRACAPISSTIGRACRSREVLFLVDAAQSAGILRTDVSRDHIDALVTSTAKGLLGIYGCGFLYCRANGLNA